jgi:hypothetical protein
MVRAGAGAGIFDKLEPELEPHKIGPAPQHCMLPYGIEKSALYKNTCVIINGNIPVFFVQMYNFRVCLILSNTCTSFLFRDIRPSNTCTYLFSAVIVPNYMTGNTRRFKDFPNTSEDQGLVESGGQKVNNDIFIYNDHNEKGGRNGIACIALAVGKRLLLIAKI